MNGAGLDMEAGGGADAVEQCGLGGRHPDLAAAGEAGEQCGAALGIEMGGDFVEEQDRWGPASVGDEVGVSEDEAE